MTDIFTDLYAPGSMWGDGSGGGSDPKNAAAYVAFLHGFLAALKPATVLDIGCGDGRRRARSIGRGRITSASMWRNRPSIYSVSGQAT